MRAICRRQAHQLSFIGVVLRGIGQGWAFTGASRDPAQERLRHARAIKQVWPDDSWTGVWQCAQSMRGLRTLTPVQ